MLPEKKELWSGRGWVISSYKNRQGSHSIAVENTKTGFIDYPILYQTGKVAYEYPERIPKTIKSKIEKIYPTIKNESIQHDRNPESMKKLDENEMNLKSLIRKIIREERVRLKEDKDTGQRAGIGRERYYIAYYETVGGHGEAGTYTSFKSAFDTATIKLKDKEFMDGLEYLGVEGTSQASEFAILFVTKSYLSRLSANMFDSPNDYNIFKSTAVKCLQTKNPQIGNFEGR